MTDEMPCKMNEDMKNCPFCGCKTNVITVETNGDVYCERSYIIMERLSRMHRKKSYRVMGKKNPVPC
jgi:hypothetical protein